MKEEVENMEEEVEKNKIDEGSKEEKKEEVSEKKVSVCKDRKRAPKLPKTTRIERAEYERLKKEAEAASEYLDHLRRLKAEFINYKKMQEKRNEEMAKFYNELLIIDLLPVLDSLDHATGNISSDNNINISSLIEGIRLIKKQFFNILSKNGVSEIETVGKVFDPKFHEAISKISTNNQSEDGIIVKEIRKGYLLRNKVIRAAQVSVASFVGEKKKEGE